MRETPEAKGIFQAIAQKPETIPARSFGGGDHPQHPQTCEELVPPASHQARWTRAKKNEEKNDVSVVNI